jgi:5-methylcytosine-specific restriction protein A
MTDPYASTAYHQARPVVLEAAGYRCQIRGPGCTGVATTVDHIIALTHGGTHQLGNLRAACLRCNSAGGGRISQAKRRGFVVGRASRRW